MLVHNTLSNLQHIFLWVCDSIQGYEYLAPLSLQHGHTSLSSSGEMHMAFTSEVSLQVLCWEFIWPFHFCYRRVKMIPGSSGK